MKCCDEPFRVGQWVEFTTTQQVDREFVSVVLGEQRAAVVTDYEDHHCLDVGPMVPLSGAVQTIEAISCRYEMQGRAMYPVAGTTLVEVQEEATGWEPEHEDVRFVGYVITLTTE